MSGQDVSCMDSGHPGTAASSPPARHDDSEDWPPYQYGDRDQPKEDVVVKNVTDARFVPTFDTGVDDEVDCDDPSNDAPQDHAQENVQHPITSAHTETFASLPVEVKS